MQSVAVVIGCLVNLFFNDIHYNPKTQIKVLPLLMPIDQLKLS